MEEYPLAGGAINAVTRRGNIVYRTGGPWVPAIHAVLDHLRAQGFAYAPRALGIDAQGRDMTSFLAGSSMMRPWRPVMFTKDALDQVATMLRELHAATRGLALPAETEWRSGPAAKAPGQVIRHGDLGPWNMLWQGDRLTGLIDWDFAEPGLPLTDLAQLALYAVPLRGDDHWRECGFPKRPDFRRRLEVLCEAYGGVEPDQVTGEVVRLQESAINEITTRAAEGRYPWTMFLENGEVERTRAELAWIRQTLPEWFPGLGPALPYPPFTPGDGVFRLAGIRPEHATNPE
ncbi:MAG: aminoglycoside phosphotransferase family protein [Chloroflexia bacterium]|nr:aminoglycoside phosphotransferase family protein [Chloroflexia bacterium]